MTPKEAFKVGFMARCADEALTSEQMADRVKAASVKVGGISELLTWLGLGSVAIPVAGGLLGGHLAARSLDDDSSVEAAKADELLGEYQRLTEDVQRHTAAKKLRGNALGIHRPRPMRAHAI